MADMLITPEELASYLQRDLNNRPTVELLIAAATGVVQAECRQRLVAVTGDTVRLLGTADRWLELPERPVTAVTSVSVGGAAVADWTLYADAKTGRARLWRGTGWRGYAGGSSCLSAPPVATVVYDHGYPAGDPALELARSAVLSLAAAGFDNPSQMQSEDESIDDYRHAVRWAAAVEAAGAAALHPNVARALRRRYSALAGSLTLAAG